MHKPYGSLSGSRQLYLYLQRSPLKRNGFTLLELMIVIVITSVLAIILLNRFFYYQEVAEKAAMEITVMNVRSGLRLRIAELMMQDRMDEMGRLMDENPILWLETPPSNYIELLGGKPERNAATPGNWHFDNERKELVYVLQHDAFFKSETDGSSNGKKAIRFRVKTVTPPRSNNGDTVRRIEGITLTSVTQYHWL